MNRCPPRGSVIVSRLPVFHIQHTGKMRNKSTICICQSSTTTGIRLQKAYIPMARVEGEEYIHGTSYGYASGLQVLSPGSSTSSGPSYRQPSQYTSLAQTYTCGSSYSITLQWFLPRIWLASLGKNWPESCQRSWVSPQKYNSLNTLRPDHPCLNLQPIRRCVLIDLARCHPRNVPWGHC